MLRAIETLRVYALALTIPATLLWARTLGPATASLLVAVHAAIVLFYGAWSVRRDLSDGVEPRLGVVRRRSAVSPIVADSAVTIGFVMCALLGLALLVSNFWIGVGALLAFAAAVWHGAQPRRDRLVRVELIAPAGLLIGPGLLFRLHAWEPAALVAAMEPTPGGPAELAPLVAPVVRPEVISAGALAATMFAGAVLLVYLLLCLVRDRQADLRDGFETTATRFPRGVAVALGWAWTLGVTLLAVVGVGAGWWGWPTGAIAAWASAAVVAALATGRDGSAVAIWAVGGSAASLAATLGV